MPERVITCGCLVVGGGPAGLSAAIAAAESGLDVAVAECLPSPGRKLLASGSGKCNVTNLLPPDTFARRFLCGFRFVRPALFAYPPEMLKTFLSNLGVPLTAPDGFHCFPKSMRAGDVLDAFLGRCRTLGVRLLPDCAIGTLLLRNGAVCGAAAPDMRFETGRVILACGGMGYPALGGRGSGYELARQAGHAVVSPVPALVGLKAAEPWAAGLPGVILSDATTRFGKKLSGRGELIFTHTGVSGPAVLDLSGSAARQLAETGKAVLECSWESRTPEEYRERFAAWQKHSGKKQLKSLLCTGFPTAFVHALCEAAAVPEERCAAQLRAEERDRLTAALAGYPLRISGTDGWNKAMATAGGVPPAEVNAGTLSSRIAAGLFFSGEMLDVGAPCGGYNIQWAVSSGRLAGNSAAKA
ncbi:MAG: aminoacetone oxidase family FAD-binding enzyme [Lentisphaeria bacterium]|nr:aminoacetone oxidase family FAD-binding enzyme [Lentisphaeria bacterium]